MVRTFWTIRLGEAAMLVGVWILSLFPLFRRHYVPIIATATCFAGLGIAGMVYLEGRDLEFYYEGFIQVLAFSAFAFRLPTKALALVSAVLLALYGAGGVYPLWRVGIDAKAQAIVINNCVSLLTFVVLALSVSAATHTVAPKVQDSESV
jgi:hypothetical protein